MKAFLIVCTFLLMCSGGLLQLWRSTRVERRFAFENKDESWPYLYAFDVSITDVERQAIQTAERRRNDLQHACARGKPTCADADKAANEYRKVLRDVESHYPGYVLQPEMLTLVKKTT